MLPRGKPPSPLAQPVAAPMGRLLGSLTTALGCVFRMGRTISMRFISGEWVNDVLHFVTLPPLWFAMVVTSSSPIGSHLYIAPPYTSNRSCLFAFRGCGVKEGIAIQSAVRSRPARRRVRNMARHDSPKPITLLTSPRPVFTNDRPLSIPRASVSLCLTPSTALVLWHCVVVGELRSSGR